MSNQESKAKEPKPDPLVKVLFKVAGGFLDDEAKFWTITKAETWLHGNPKRQIIFND